MAARANVLAAWLRCACQRDTSSAAGLSSVKKQLASMILEQRTPHSVGGDNSNIPPSLTNTPRGRYRPRSYNISAPHFTNRTNCIWCSQRRAFCCCFSPPVHIDRQEDDRQGTDGGETQVKICGGKASLVAPPNPIPANFFSFARERMTRLG